MALYRGTIRSMALSMDTTVNVIIPESHYIQAKAPEKTLILLHGMKQNADSWVRMSKVETYAHLAGFNVIIPEVQRSFYTDMKHGLKYFTYVAEELPEMMGKTFNIPVDREHLYTAGLSMGGYGALKCALTYPDRYAGAMSFSGGLYCLDDVPAMAIMSNDEFQAVLGMELNCTTRESLKDLAVIASKSSNKPKLYVACGTEDSLLPMSREFAEHTKSLGYDITYEEWEGIHDWFFWDRALARGMAVMSELPVSEVNKLDTEEV